MKKYKALIIIMVILALGFAYFFLNKEDAIEVTSMKSYTGSITKVVEVSGFIDAEKTEVIPLEANQKVIKTYVKENDLVDVNTLLAELDTRDFELSLRKAKVNLDELNADLNNLANDRNDSLLLSNAVTRSNEEYSIISRDLEIAEENLLKAQVLYDEGAISKADYDNYALQVNKLTSNLKKAELSIKDATANYDIAVDNKSQRISSLQRQIESLNIDIESLNKKIEDSKIYSNTRGFITEFPLEEANKILSGQKISIYGTSSYELVAQISQEDAVLIKEGLNSIVQIDGLSKDYEGKVSFISKTASKDNGSTEPKIEIRVKIQEPDDSVLFGYEGNAYIIIDKDEDVLIVKNESIIKNGDKEYLYVLDGNKTKKVLVETGLSDGYLTTIKSGINVGDLVILNPPSNLEEGSTVKVIQ